ncbi:MAG: ATP-binding protein [Oscillospiraceae bacterium]|nr:ATP-binding protein [Oscillospiraceae bacterium]
MSLRQKESGGQRKLPIALDAFDIVRETLISAAGNTAELRQALLACDEWIANVVHYSAAEDFAFAFRVDGSTLHVSFSDDGIPFDPTLHVGAAKEFEALDLGGMGLALIRESAADMTYERVNGRNVLRLSFFIPSGDGNCEEEESI